jgi:hypothetical protein
MYVDISLGLKMKKLNNRVQINLDEEEALLYQKIKNKKVFFSAMLNIAYKNPIYRELFFDEQNNTIQTISEDIDTKEPDTKEPEITQKKKTSVSSWS